jgi:hypothetical protein
MPTAYTTVLTTAIDQNFGNYRQPACLAVLPRLAMFPLNAAATIYLYGIVVQLPAYPRTAKISPCM